MNLNPQIYFVHESPDFSFLIENGKPERLAANRVATCVMTEYGMMNDSIMGAKQFSRFIFNAQTAVIIKD